MKKKLLTILIILSAAIISYLVSFTYYNYGVFRSGSLDYRVFVNDKEIDNNVDYHITKDTAIVIYNNNCNFVNRVEFDYETATDFDWHLVYTYNNEFGLLKDTGFEDKSKAFINKYSYDLNKKICMVRIELGNKNQEISVSNIRLVNNINYFSNKIIFFTIITTSICAFILFRKYFLEKIERLFVYISLVFGISIILLTPFGLFKSWDDEYHFNRAYGVVYKSDTTASAAFKNPINPWQRFHNDVEVKEYIRYLNDNNNNEVQNDVHFNRVDVSYMGYIIGIFIGKITHSSFYTTIIMSLISNLILYTIIVYLAIRYAKKGKLLLLVLGLLPTTLYMNSSFNYDAIVTAFVLLGFSLFFNEVTKDEINIKRLMASIACFVIGTLSKPVYALFAILVLFINKKKFRDKKEMLLSKLSVVFGFGLVLVIILMPMVINNNTGDTRGGNTCVSCQIQSMKNSPLGTMIVYKNNVLDNSINSFIGQETLACFGWMRVRFVDRVYYLFLLLILLATMFANYDGDKKSKNNKLDKVTIAGLIFLLFSVISLIWLSLYLSYTEVGENVIKGVQGRYFIPLLFPILMLFTNKTKLMKMDNNKINTIVALLLFYSLYVSVLCNLYI